MTDSQDKALLLQQFQQVSLPYWSRFLLAGACFVFIVTAFALLLFTFALPGICAAGWLPSPCQSVKQPSDELRTAIVSLFSFSVPIFLIGLLLATAEGGVRSLQKRSIEMLTVTVPTALRSAGSDGRPAIIETLFQTGGTYAEYEVRAPTGINFASIRIGIDLNVRKASVRFFLPTSTLSRRVAPGDKSGEGALRFDQVQEQFSHSLHAAVEYEQYLLNKALFTIRRSEIDYVVIVAVKLLSRDFLWNPAERLYFAQDLAFFVRSMLLERPDVFRELDSK